MSARCPGFMLAQLRLLEVGGDPEVVERDDLHHLLTDLHVLTDFHRAVADDSG